MFLTTGQQQICLLKLIIGRWTVCHLTGDRLDKLDPNFASMSKIKNFLESKKTFYQKDLKVEDKKKKKAIWVKKRRGQGLVGQGEVKKTK